MLLVLYRLVQIRDVALSTQAAPQFIVHNVWRGTWVIIPSATRVFIPLLQGTPHLRKPLSSQHLEHETQLKIKPLAATME